MKITPLAPAVGLLAAIVLTSVPLLAADLPSSNQPARQSTLTTSDAIRQYTEALRKARANGDTAREQATLKQLEQALIAAEPAIAKQQADLRQQLQDYRKRIDSGKTNATAKELESLVANRFGFSIQVTANLPPASVNAAQSRAYNLVRKPLEQYLRTQVTRPTSSLQPIPAALKQYLETQRSNLDQAETLLLSATPPQWEIDTKWIGAGPEYALPNYLGLVSLQQLLMLKALFHAQQANPAAMETSLAAAWQLSQSPRHDPSLLSQLVTLIMVRYQTGVMRQLSSLSPEWQRKLERSNYRQMMQVALEGESLSRAAWLSRVQPKDLQEFFRELAADETLNFKALGFANWSPSLQRRYFSWTLLNWTTGELQAYQQLSQENACSLQETQLARQVDTPYSISWLGVWRKVAYLELELEMTRKVLQVETQAKAMGEVPGKVPGIELSSCSGSRWVYRKLGQQQYSLILTPPPKVIPKNAVALTFQGNLK